MDRAESEQGENKDSSKKGEAEVTVAAAITRYLPRLAPNRIFGLAATRPGPAKSQGGAPMVGWSGWRNPAMPRWHLSSARRRKRSKPREPSPESTPVANVPAERDAVPAALQSSGNHVLEHAESDTREAVRNASSSRSSPKEWRRVATHSSTRLDCAASPADLLPRPRLPRPRPPRPRPHRPRLRCPGFYFRRRRHRRRRRHCRRRHRP